MIGMPRFFSSKGMDDYVRQARETAGAVIVDVRSPAEFAQGHVEGAVNVPGTSIERIAKIVPDKDTPLYLHCQSGVRSGAASRTLKAMGYTNVTNMGGISRYSGTVVKGSR